MLIPLFLTAGEKCERIISLCPAVTESVYLLAAQELLVGCTTYCVRPKEARLKPQVGSVMEVNIESVIQLNPDIVIATVLTDPRFLRALADLKIRYEIMPEIKTFDGVCDQFMKTAQLTGKEIQASEIIAKAGNEIFRIRNCIPESNKPRVLVQIGIKPLFVATKDSFINDMIKCAGGVNIAENAASGLFSREKVLEENPDFIFVVTMEEGGSVEAEIWDEYPGLKAVGLKQIKIFDANPVCSPTPLSFSGTVLDMFEILHGHHET